jgi:NAD(P)-dependent dehydrogenase (short-subunit alcohol dehydrogenase family)
MTEISGKTAVVTGGGSGVGRAVALALADEGARVVVADILEENAEKTAQVIRQAGGAAIAAFCDVSDRAAVRALKKKANEAFGPVLIVIPNAGATSVKPMRAISEDDIDWIVQVNFMGVMNFIHMFLPDMLAAKDGHFVASASVAGLIPDLVADHVPYSAAKAGVIALMLNLRRELEGTGVQSTVFCVASVDSGMRENNAKYRPKRFGGPYEETVVMPSSFSRGYARPPEEVAPMVIAAIRNNRPALISDPNYRKAFMERYVSVILQAFDDVDAFYASRVDLKEVQHER